MAPSRGVSDNVDKFDKFAEEPSCTFSICAIALELSLIEFLDGPVLDAFLVKVVNAHVELNPLLTVPSEDDPSDPPFLKWNMLFPTAQCQRSTDPGHRSWAAGRYAPATWPRVKSLRLISRTFPWEIQIKAEDEALGVTCQDVIEGIHDFMYSRVSSQQLGNASPQHKRIVGQSYWHNRSTARDVPGGRLHNTLLRCDWLGLNTRFGGVGVADERLLEDVIGGAEMPCTFELKCLPRYALSEDELREHDAREEAAFGRGHSRRTSRATSRAPSRAPSRTPSSRTRAASVHTVSSDTSDS
ncbi:hypothetical protein BDY19DRAFT_895639 [Irpex rosettiformis]|uniref:Uncharacterized protein n=1 Tax=Irpex rosettiformis TaxID=378272 RepID=A0ACB8TVA4_9APHY|nr:hypothetical protein BDY19DRAFT_895639 [Irpex rosettiformis]